MSDLDQRLELWIVSHRAGLLDPIFVGLSYAGTLGALWLAIGLAAAFVLRRPLLFPTVVAALLMADLASRLVKDAVDRPRPPRRLEAVDALVPVPSSASFPSGHAATSFAAAVVLCVALPSLAPAFVAVAAAVAFSRAYAGVHYPADVIAGAALGALVATALLLLVRALRRSRLRQTRDRPRARLPGRPSPPARPGSR